MSHAVSPELTDSSSRGGAQERSPHLIIGPGIDAQIAHGDTFHADKHALEVNDSAVKILGDETLKTIARELVDTVRRNTTIDWTVRENVRAHLRVLVKRILRKYGYPPDKQEKATATVLEQAEVLSSQWPIA